MSETLMISKNIVINASPEEVWDVLVNPAKIKEYFTGAVTLTDWKIGSEILFIHIYEGKEFKNMGIILSHQPPALLEYSYWTAFSNTEDKPENYTRMTYQLTAIGNKTKLTLTQTNFKSVEWYEGLVNGWDTVLNKIKALAEAQTIN